MTPHACVCRWVRKGALAAALLGLATGCIVLGYQPSSVARAVLPECCVAQWREADRDAYDEKRRTSHPAEVEAFAEHRRLALAHASEKALLDDLQRRAATLKPTSVGQLRPGLGREAIEKAFTSAGLQVSDEVKTLFAWHDGVNSCAEGQAVFFSHCFLSIEQSLLARKNDRELYLGMPVNWLPLFTFGSEVLYVVSDSLPSEDQPTASSPMLWVSLVSPVEAVAFTNLRTLVATHLAWDEEQLWPPDALDAAQRQRFEALHAELNPGAWLPW